MIFQKSWKCRIRNFRNGSEDFWSIIAMVLGFETSVIFPGIWRKVKLNHWHLTDYERSLANQGFWVWQGFWHGMIRKNFMIRAKTGGGGFSLESFALVDVCHLFFRFYLQLLFHLGFMCFSRSHLTIELDPSLGWYSRQIWVEYMEHV